MTCEEAGCPQCAPGGTLSREQLQQWLNRPPPPRHEPEPEEPPLEAMPRSCSKCEGWGCRECGNG